MANNEEINGVRTWLEVDRKALKHNYETIRKLIPKTCRLMSVVKSNAYGHGLVGLSKEVETLGVDWLGVDTLVEALALRREGVKKPILILGYTLPSMFEKAVEAEVSITISTFESLNFLETLKVKKPLKIHIKVDTGMGRQGFLIQDSPKVLDKLKVKGQMSNVEIEGLYTHFAAAKNPAFLKYTNGQLEQFEKWVTAFKEAGFNPIKHAAASSGTLIFPNSHLDMVRVGIALYGLWPSPEVESFCKSKFELKPVLSWKTVVSEIKTLKKGSKVGYDLTETLDKDTKIAICPIGYWHGYTRAFSSIGRVIVGGKKCRIIGRVSMDMIVVDITDVSPNPKVGDEAVVIGRQGQEEMTADDLAYLSDTTNYEVVTRINPLIKKIYV